MARLTLLTVAVVLGCTESSKAGDDRTPRERQCEEARASFERSGLAQLERTLDQLDPPSKDELRQEARKKIAHIDSRFVGKCMKADSETIACLTRVDEMDAEAHALPAALEACPTPACRQQLRRAHEEKYGDCPDRIGDFALRILQD